MARITINGIWIDPDTETQGEGEELTPPKSATLDSLQSDYLLIQAEQSLTREQIAELSNLGVSVLEYLPPDNRSAELREGLAAYVCYYPKGDLGTIRSLSYVRLAGRYLHHFKLPQALSVTNIDSPGLFSLVEDPHQPEAALPVRQVDVVFYDNVRPKDVYQAVATAAHVDPGDLQLGRHKVRFSIDPQYLPAVAAIDEVRHIEAVLPAELHNDVARTILGLNGASPQSVFEGQGQIVVVADSGFDVGETASESVHPAFKGRVLKLFPLGRPGKSDDPNGHGTHVAGSALGDGISTKNGPVRGAAPKAKLIVQSLAGTGGGLAGLPADLADLFEPPYVDFGARIHTNSWGREPGKSQYNEDSREVDDFVWNHRDAVICFSAGNGGNDNQGTGNIASQTVTPPGTAKNCITVGASETIRTDVFETYHEFRSADFPVDPIASRNLANNPESVAAFSSRGPTQDGRFKPDLVAPGTFILSTRSRQLPVFVSSSSQDDEQFVFNHGTSMATPLVAGCVAVLREFLASQHQLPNPSAALLKALLINGAREISGGFQPTPSANVPNHAAGFGRVDLRTTIGPSAPDQTFKVTDEGAALTETMQEEKTTVTIRPEDSQLKVTLVWTDFPGSALMNDLDLIVKAANGEERHGNQPPGSIDFDRVNNVEQVLWPDIPDGEAEIIVRAHHIWQPQSYALVVRVA